MDRLTPEVLDRARRVRLVLLDVDGVLTDGLIHIGPDGHDGRSFHARDGLGVRLGQSAGLIFGIVSGRESKAVAARAEELDITEVHQRIEDKVACLHDICSRLDVAPEAVCYVGDDLVDVPVMRRVGFAAAPADAAPEARDAAHYVAQAGGGRGAVREVIDVALRASGRWNQVTERHFK